MRSSKKALILILAGFFSVSAIRLSEVRELKVGKAPTYAALSPDGRHLFVTNYASDEIYVIDLKAHRNKTRFYGGHEPVGVAVTPAGDKIFVTNLGNGLVKVIDAKTYEILDDITVDGMPSNITMSTRGFEALVTNYGRGKIGRIDFIDTNTHRILAEVEVGVRPLAAVPSLLGDHLYIACGGSNELYVIALNNREVIKQIPVGIAPDGLALSPDGTLLYVANSGTDDLSVIDLIDLEEVRRVAVGSKPFSVAVHPDGFIFVVETGDNALSVYSPELERVTSVKTPKKPIDVELSSDGRFAYVTAEKDNRVVIYEVTSDQTVTSGR